MSPSEFEQLDLLTVGKGRARGPRQSQLTVDSLANDTRLKYDIARAVLRCSARTTASDEDYTQPVTDDD